MKCEESCLEGSYIIQKWVWETGYKDARTFYRDHWNSESKKKIFRK